MLTREQIQEIYSFVKENKDPEYLNKYNALPLDLNNGEWKWEGKDFARIISLLEFREFMQKNNFGVSDLLTFSGQGDPEVEFINHATWTDLCYDTDPDIADLHVLNLPKKDFDFVMINQVLEHLYNPLLCIQNIYNHMKKDGILYVSAPANNKPHQEPYHFYTGFTLMGLGVLLKISGFKILKLGQWGNKEYLNTVFNSKNWPDYRKLKFPSINDYACPITVWGFGIK